MIVDVDMCNYGNSGAVALVRSNLTRMTINDFKSESVCGPLSGITYISICSKRCSGRCDCA